MKQIKPIVQRILEEEPTARNSDYQLINLVLKELGFDIFLSDEQPKEMPSFESITRCRRFFQTRRPDLQASSKVKVFREEKQEEFRSQASNGWMNNY